MIFSLAHITGWLIHYGYFVLFPFVMAEGPIVTIVSGSLCAVGIFRFLPTLLVVVFADLSADCLYYATGRFGGEKFLKKWGRYFGIGPKQTAKLEKHFDVHGGKTLIIGKMSHGIGGAFLVAAGMAKMPFAKFGSYSFFATIIKSLALLLVGYFFGQVILKINSFFQIFAIVAILILVVVAVCYFYFKKNE